jgi:hypothetical protein
MGNWGLQLRRKIGLLLPETAFTVAERGGMTRLGIFHHFQSYNTEYYIDLFSIHSR